MFGNLNINFIKKIDNQVLALVKAIQETIGILILMVKVCSRSKLGFTLKCKEAQMKVQRLWKIFNQLETKKTWEEYRAARLEARYIIRKASQKAYWESYKKAYNSVAKM